jgi:putative hydrolase of the HAD superfamily
MPLIHVFDLGNVLLLYDYGLFVGRIRDCCREQVAIEETVAELYRQSGIGRGAEFEPFYQTVVRSLGLDMPLLEFRLAWSDIFSRHDPMLQVVRQAPRPRFLLSNTDACHVAWIEQRFPEVFPLFDACVLSNQVGAEKPDPAIYRQVERLSGVPPEQHVFIDDMPPFVSAARQLGWRAIQFTGVDDVVRQLALLNAAVP